jgi:hypothetical protein
MTVNELVDKLVDIENDFQRVKIGKTLNRIHTEMVGVDYILIHIMEWKP